VKGSKVLLEAQQSTGTRRECLQLSLEVRVRLTHPMTAYGRRDALVPSTRRPQVGPLENPRKPASATTSQRFHSFLPFHSRPYNPFLNLIACCPHTYTRFLSPDPVARLNPTYVNHFGTPRGLNSTKPGACLWAPSTFDPDLPTPPYSWLPNMKFASALGALGASSVLLSGVGAVQLDISSPGWCAPWR
jgi:hypothetical protein